MRGRGGWPCGVRRPSLPSVRLVGPVLVLEPVVEAHVARSGGGVRGECGLVGRRVVQPVDVEVAEPVLEPCLESAAVLVVVVGDEPDGPADEDLLDDAVCRMVSLRVGEAGAQAYRGAEHAVEEFAVVPVEVPVGQEVRDGVPVVLAEMRAAGHAAQTSDLDPRHGLDHGQVLVEQPSCAGARHGVVAAGVVVHRFLPYFVYLVCSPWRVPMSVICASTILLRRSSSRIPRFSQADSSTQPTVAVSHWRRSRATPSSRSPWTASWITSLFLNCVAACSSRSTGLAGPALIVPSRPPCSVRAV